MASGPEHYRDAEDHLRFAADNRLGSPDQSWNLAAAQVHATLALAAATALNDNDPGTPTPTWHEWLGATRRGQSEARTDLPSTEKACGQEHEALDGDDPLLHGWIIAEVHGSTDPDRWYCSPECATKGIAVAHARLEPFPT